MAPIPLEVGHGHGHDEEIPEYVKISCTGADGHMRKPSLIEILDFDADCNAHFELGHDGEYLISALYLWVPIFCLTIIISLCCLMNLDLCWCPCFHDYRLDDKAEEEEEDDDKADVKSCKTCGSKLRSPTYQSLPPSTACSTVLQLHQNARLFNQSPPVDIEPIAELVEHSQSTINRNMKSESRADSIDITNL